ncbi:succinate dehydrogenase cytochrome b558 subunit [Carboxydocella sp. ULO1]|uniref:succinate dehydrogenase cytochrome b558 subunit n=1 Tax=Carboxydocella sp. ULO1 TaxID=1926599 RepID=UPI0009AEB22C|nr:succinate dehydrogenase cytochrome b558 subunit [Carboxydocella sp. ULO1]GAW29939.1 succinate dehydrogenase [Carboxydocella sp. ULO1]
MSTNSFFLRRIHSLSGLIPIGLFLLEHLFTNSFALKGAKAFNEKIEFFQTLPYLTFIEILFIGLPIAFHAFYGLYIVYVAKNNILSYSYFRNWMFYLQRVTAIVTLVFLVWHVYVLRLAKALYDTEVSFEAISASLSNPGIFAFYIVGLVAAVFHFANGLWTFLITWGITIGPRAQQVTTYVTGLLFLVLNIIGINVLVAFTR